MAELSRLSADANTTELEFRARKSSLRLAEPSTMMSETTQDFELTSVTQDAGHADLASEGVSSATPSAVADHQTEIDTGVPSHG